MRYDDYCRLHLACLGIAKHCSSPEVQARWRAMAQMIEDEMADLEPARRRFVSTEPKQRTQAPHSGQASMAQSKASCTQERISL
jgi:hypothetical protein